MGGAELLWLSHPRGAQASEEPQPACRFLYVIPHKSSKSPPHLPSIYLFLEAFPD